MTVTLNTVIDLCVSKASWKSEKGAQYQVLPVLDNKKASEQWFRQVEAVQLFIVNGEKFMFKLTAIAGPQNSFSIVFVPSQD